MSDRAYTRESWSSDAVLWLKKETRIAVVRFFAPIVVLYNVVMAIAGLPTVKWPIDKE